MKCAWCEQEGAKETVKDCEWIDPTGKDMLTVEKVPAIDCPTCRDVYIDDELNEKVEEALNSVDLQTLGHRFTYDELMEAPQKSIFEWFQAQKEEGTSDA